MGTWKINTCLHVGQTFISKFELRWRNRMMVGSLKSKKNFVIFLGSLAELTFHFLDNVEDTFGCWRDWAALAQRTLLAHAHDLEAEMAAWRTSAFQLCCPVAQSHARVPVSSLLLTLRPFVMFWFLCVISLPLVSPYPLFHWSSSRILWWHRLFAWVRYARIRFPFFVYPFVCCVPWVRSQAV